MYKLFLALLLYSFSASAQPKTYTTANAHSHNDYEQSNPFWKAYNRQFGSMEADIFLRNDSDTLWVAHTLMELNTKKRSLDALYLQPLATCIRKNKGYVYADTGRKLQLMIDIKTAAIPTLDRLIKVLQQYPDIINCPSLQIVISGNRPDPAQFASYPSFIWFDGNIKSTYPETALAKIVMMSADWKQFSSWNGTGELPAAEQAAIKQAIEQMHRLNKRVRFWGAPDTLTAWKTFISLQSDYINTDSIDALADYLKK